MTTCKTSETGTSHFIVCPISLDLCDKANIWPEIFDFLTYIMFGLIPLLTHILNSIQDLIMYRYVKDSSLTFFSNFEFGWRKADPQVESKILLFILLPVISLFHLTILLSTSMANKNYYLYFLYILIGTEDWGYTATYLLGGLLILPWHGNCDHYPQGLFFFLF